MSNEVITVDQEVEAERLRRIQEISRDEGPTWAERFGPGSFGCHELLDRAALIARIVEDSLLEHPSCLLDAEWYALADRAVTAINDLYQRVGSVHE